MQVIPRIRPVVHDVHDKINAIASGLDGQSMLLDQNMRGLIQGMDNQSRILAVRLDRIVQGFDNRLRLIDQRFQELIQRPPKSGTMAPNAMQRAAEKASPSYKEIPDYVRGILRPDRFRNDVRVSLPKTVN